MTFGSAVLSFALVAGLVTVIPGLDTALVLRVAVVDGRRYAYATALGICSGALIWGAAAAAGVSVLLTASTLAYTAMRWAGAAYLAYLGATMLRDAWSKRDALVALDQLATRSWRRSYRRGVLTNLLNPKVGVFFVSFLPGFVPAGHSVGWITLGFGLWFAVLTAVYFAVLVAVSTTVASWMSTARIRRRLDALTGLVLVGFGLRLATEA